MDNEKLCAIMRQEIPTPDEREFYDAMIAEMQRQMRKRPKLVTINVIRILGRILGCCIGMCRLEEREIAKREAFQNLDSAIKDIT